MNLTKMESEILAALRDNVEAGTGDGWMNVYILNAKPKNMTPHQFAGVLSNLQQKGLYRPRGDNYFGDVKI